MKINIKKPKLNFRKSDGAPRHGRRRLNLPHWGGKRFAKTETDPGFDAVIRSSEPIMTVSADKKYAGWQNDMLRNLFCALLLCAAISVFCMCIYEPMLILFTLPCLLMFMAITTVEYFKPGPVRLIVAVAAAIVLLIAVFIWHNTIFGGLAMLINRFYDAAEEAQAYLYDRIPGGDAATVTDGRIGIAWASCMLGLLAALPPMRFRRTATYAIAAAVMLSLAYYGLLPALPCMAVFAAAFILAMSRGGVLSVLPVMLAALLLFGVIALADPGEINGISRMDENFRDRFAFKTALLETNSGYDENPYDNDAAYDDEDEGVDEDGSLEEDGYGSIVITGIIIAIAAAVAAAVYLLHRRLAKRRALYRRGIESADPREAVTAMFPYTVRWLRGFGVETPQPAFTSMIPSVKETFEEPYARRFAEMYDVWTVAAYSDHPISEDCRMIMNTFMKDTINMVKDKSKLKDKLRLHFKHAL